MCGQECAGSTVTSDAVRLRLSYFPHIPHPQDKQKIAVQVDDSSYVLSVELDVTRDTCLFDFKKLVAAKEGVRTEQVHLTIGGKEYPDTKKFALVAHLDFVLKLIKVMFVLLLTPPHVVSCTICPIFVIQLTSALEREKLATTIICGYLNCICTLLHDGVCLQGPVSHFT